MFVNLALFGYKQPQQLTTLAYLMSIGGQFDLVLNIDGFNEVAASTSWRTPATTSIQRSREAGTLDSARTTRSSA